jgi:hypothetical protein
MRANQSFQALDVMRRRIFKQSLDSLRERLFLIWIKQPGDRRFPDAQVALGGLCFSGLRGDLLGA